MLRRKMKDDRKGIGGFFFDTPVLLLIIVVITVFTTSLYQIYAPIQEEKERIAQDRICIDLKNSIQNYNAIHTEGEEKFSIEKLETLEEGKLDSHVDLKADYEYNISFKILDSDASWSFGRNLTHEKENSAGGISSYRIPVSLVDEERSSYLGELKVSIWRT